MAEITSELVKQSPGLAAAVIVVLLFLKAQKERDAEWRAFLAEERKNRTVDTDRIMIALNSLVEACGNVHGDLREMDTYLRASLDAMRAAKARKATGK